MKPVMGDFNERMKELDLNLETMYGLDVHAEIVKSFADEYIAQLDIPEKPSMERYFALAAAINDLEMSTDDKDDFSVGLRVLNHLITELGLVD